MSVFAWKTSAPVTGLLTVRSEIQGLGIGRLTILNMWFSWLGRCPAKSWGPGAVSHDSQVFPWRVAGQPWPSDSFRPALDCCEENRDTTTRKQQAKLQTSREFGERQICSETWVKRTFLSWGMFRISALKARSADNRPVHARLHG